MRRLTVTLTVAGVYSKIDLRCRGNDNTAKFKSCSRHKFMLFLTVCIALLLTACNPLAPVKVEEVAHYTLNQYPQERYASTKDTTLLVAQPLVDTSLASSRMFYTDKTFALKSYAYSDWATPPAIMLQNLMVKSLNYSHLFHTVIKEPIMVKSDYRLISNLYLLQQELSGERTRSHVQVGVTLMESKTHKVIATRLFDVAVPMLHNTPYEGVIAMNQATSQFLKQLNQFVRVHTHATAQRTDITPTHLTPLATPFV